MTADLAGEAQLSVNERDRPQQGVRICREEGKHGRKPSLVKYGDCNRREIRRLGEPPENVRSGGTRSVRNVGVSRDLDRNGAPARRTGVDGGNKTETRKTKRARAEGPTPAARGLTSIKRRLMQGSLDSRA
ncbi:hypothetical protein YC2023_022876 [Brassica napus]